MVATDGDLVAAGPLSAAWHSRAKARSAEGGREHRRRAHLKVREPRRGAANARMARMGARDWYRISDSNR
jgi:hypothetical protein